MYEGKGEAHSWLAGLWANINWLKLTLYIRTIKTVKFQRLIERKRDKIDKQEKCDKVKGSNEQRG